MQNRRINLNDIIENDRFIQLPQLFFVEESPYAAMRLESKVLYSLLRNRTSLSSENKNFIDENGDIFVIMENQEIQQNLSIGKTKAIEIKDELRRFGLIDEVRQGLGRPNLIYVRSIAKELEFPDSNLQRHEEEYLESLVENHEETFSEIQLEQTQGPDFEPQKFEERTQEVQKTDTRGSDIEHERFGKRSLEVRNSVGSNTYNNYTDFSKTEKREKEQREVPSRTFSAGAPSYKNLEFDSFFKPFIDLDRRKLSSRANATQEFAILNPMQRERAIIGAENYVAWYKASNPPEEYQYLTSPAKFLENSMFEDFQEIPEIKKANFARTPRRKGGII